MVFLFCTAAAIAAPAQTFKTVFTFDGTNGNAPSGALVQGRDGNYYGVTLYGGASTVCGGGCGAVFKITAAGTLTTLHSFCSLTNCADGENPSGGLILGTDGNFYGVTANYNSQPAGACSQRCGTVFKITPEGALTTLHTSTAPTGRNRRPGWYRASTETSTGQLSWEGPRADCATRTHEAAAPSSKSPQAAR